LSATMSTMNALHSSKLRNAQICVCVVFLLCVLIWTAGASSAYATDRGNLAEFLRGGNELTVGDAVTFGVLPPNTGVEPKNAAPGSTDHLPIPSAFVPGTPIPWYVVEVGEDDGVNYAILLIARDHDIGYRPANGFAGPYPLYANYRPWAGSELSAWLNSSRASNGVDYSLETGGAGAYGVAAEYGFLERAFSKEQQQLALLPYGTTEMSIFGMEFDVDQKIVLLSEDDVYSWGLFLDNQYPADRKWSVRDPLDSVSGNFYTQGYGFRPSAGGLLNFSFSRSDEDIAVRPLIRINLDAEVFENAWGKADQPIIIEQPKSATYALGDSIEDLKVDARVEDTGTILSYQWYREDGSLIEDATDPEFTPDVEPGETGRFVYYCEVTNGNSDPARTIEAIISISGKQDAQLPCSDCHSSNVRKWHTGFNRGEGYCTTCHGNAPEDWSDNDYPEDGFEGYLIGCGLGDNNCHGADSDQEWHGEDILTLHNTVNEVIEVDPETGVAKYPEVKLPIGINSCGGNEGDLQCHVRNSVDSPFSFGSMNLLTAHNDYAKAQESESSLVATEALGKSGCLACHETDGKKPIIAEGNEPVTCATCHQEGDNSAPNASYELSTQAGNPLHYKPSKAASDNLGGSGTRTGVMPATPSQQTIVEPVEASLGVQHLVNGLLGTTSNVEPLEAGVVEPPAPQLPRGSFPVGSILEGSNLFSR